MDIRSSWGDSRGLVGWYRADQCDDCDVVI